MLNRLQTFAKQSIRAMQRGGWFPILLPHHRVVEGGLSTLGAPPTPMPGELLAALKFCDGARSLAQIARETGASRQQLLAARAEGLLILWPQPLAGTAAPLKQPAAIILSPHLDDAALSLGGMMLARRGAVIVVDVFSTVSWWRFACGPEILPKIQQTRDAEEALVMRLAGCAQRAWGHGEAPLRGYALADIFTAEIRPSDDDLRRSVRDSIAQLADRYRGATTFFVPLGIGNHVDHRILRDAAIEALRPGHEGMARVRFYEDLPYAAKAPQRRDFSAFVPGLRLRPAKQFRYNRLKTELLQVYWSQLTAAQIRRVGAYGERFALGRTERTWRYDPSP